MPGTPEQVWWAIATGPGITAWLHHTEVEEREGGRYAFDMGSGLNQSGVVSVWDPPHRFATAGVRWEPGQDADPALPAPPKRVMAAVAVADLDAALGCMNASWDGPPTTSRWTVLPSGA